MWFFNDNKVDINIFKQEFYVIILSLMAGNWMLFTILPISDKYLSI